MPAKHAAICCYSLVALTLPSALLHCRPPLPPHCRRPEGQQHACNKGHHCKKKPALHPNPLMKLPHAQLHNCVAQLQRAPNTPRLSSFDVTSLLGQHRRQITYGAWHVRM